MRIAILLTVLIGGLFQAEAFDPAQQDDSQALVRHFKKPPNPVGPPIKEGSFVPNAGETITLMGGADVYQMQRDHYFDVLMHSAWGGKSLRIRNIGWSADTVYRQQRPMFFFTTQGDEREGSVPDLREKIDPGTMLLMFGKMESLEGLSKLSDFEAAYEELIVALKSYSQRIVLVSPIGFSPKGPAAELAKERNEALKAYRQSIEDLAARHALTFIEIGEFKENASAANGVHLSKTGHGQLGVRIATGLGWNGQWAEGIEPLVQKKNQLWYQYYRPTNWAFLFGDRQNVPSSRDNEDPERRWFVEEIERIPPLIAETEKKIWKYTEGGVK